MTANFRKSKRSALLMFALTLVLIVSACSSSNAGSGSKTKKVIIGTTNVFPGVSFLDEKGNLTGFDVELAKELQASSGIRVRNSDDGFRQSAAQPGDQ